MSQTIVKFSDTWELILTDDSNHFLKTWFFLIFPSILPNINSIFILISRIIQ